MKFPSNPARARSRPATRPIRYVGGWLGLAMIAWAGGWTVRGQAVSPVVEGITDRQVAVPPVRFRVRTEPGYTSDVRLDGAPIESNEWVDVSAIGYHAVIASQTGPPPAPPASVAVRFVILDPSRGETEFGLATWTPRPPVASAPGELAGGGIQIMAPADFPAELPMPVVGWVRTSTGQRLAVNGTVTVESGGSQQSLPIKRGVGSTWLPPANGSYEGTLSARWHGLAVANPLVIATHDAWTEVSGEIASDLDWPANARVSVTADLTIRSAATLRVHAGAIVKLAAGVTINVEGRVLVEGTTGRPAVFLPADPASPWGGFVLLQAPAGFEATGTVFAGSGADSRWYITHPIGWVHRTEQALLHLGPGVTATLRDCALIDLAGQAFNGMTAELSLDRCLIQRCTTGGQYNDGSMRVHDSAVLDIPNDDSQFVDGDNDGFYLTLGRHEFTDTLIGWTKDDGIDAGGSQTGDVTVERCWFEGMFHEGLALSGTNKLVRVGDSVVVNCGQGVEAGYLSPLVEVGGSLLNANFVGARFGDNYTYTHTGSLTVTNSLILYNQRDAWGFVRELWAEDLSRMQVVGNRLSQPDPLHSDNAIWNPSSDGGLLSTWYQPAGGKVGVGFLAASGRTGNLTTNLTVPVGLSCFSPQPVLVRYVLEPTSATPGIDLTPVSGTVRFVPGEVEQPIGLAVLANPARRFEVRARLRLFDPVNAEFGSDRAVHWLVLGLPPSAGDADGDGLPDSWEEVIMAARSQDAIRTREDVHPDDDFDGDGMTNGAEFLAGCDPTDPSSRLALKVRATGAGAVDLSFRGAADRRFRLEATDALGPSGSWRVMQEFGPSSTPQDYALTEPSSTGPRSGFYRVTLVTSP